MHDGGSIYNLSANPGTVIEDNYMYNNNSTVALYLDEGSRYLTVSSNVVQDAGVWAFTNANANNNTDNNTFSGNWYNGGATEVATGSPHNNVLTGNVQVSGNNWPSGAQQVIQPGRHPELGRRVPDRLSPAGRSATTACAWTCTATPPPAGAAIDQWTCNGQPNQQFQFVPGLRRLRRAAGPELRRRRHRLRQLPPPPAPPTSPSSPRAGPPAASGSPCSSPTAPRQFKNPPAACAWTSTAPAATSASNSTSGHARTPPAPTRTSPPS